MVRNRKRPRRQPASRGRNAERRTYGTDRRQSRNHAAIEDAKGSIKGRDLEHIVLEQGVTKKTFERARADLVRDKRIARHGGNEHQREIRWELLVSVVLSPTSPETTMETETIPLSDTLGAQNQWLTAPQPRPNPVPWQLLLWAGILRLWADAGAGRRVCSRVEVSATRKAYASDLRDFSAWCDRHDPDAMPASPQTAMLLFYGVSRQG